MRMWKINVAEIAGPGDTARPRYRHLFRTDTYDNGTDNGRFVYNRIAERFPFPQFLVELTSTSGEWEHVDDNTVSRSHALPTLSNSEPSIEAQMIGEFRRFVQRNGLNEDMDAEEMLASDSLTAEQRSWLLEFVARWDAHTLHPVGGAR